MNAKISVIIPTYNRAAYVGRAIESVLQQTYSNIEIIVSDNASEDDTENIIKKYLTNDKVKYHRNGKNVGGTANINKSLIKYATGEYALILSDDDSLIDPNYIEKAMALFKKDSEMVMVFANFQETAIDHDRVINRVEFSMPDSIVDGRWIWMNYCKQNLFCPLLTTIFRRDIALNIAYRGIFRDIPSGDMLLFLCILVHGKVGFINTIVANYAIHSENHFERIRKAKEVYILYRDLDFIKVAAEYALAQDVFSAQEILTWKSRMLMTRMREHLMQFCLPAMRQGDVSMFQEYYLAVKAGGDSDLLVYTMAEIIRR